MSKLWTVAALLALLATTACTDNNEPTDRQAQPSQEQGAIEAGGEPQAESEKPATKQVEQTEQTEQPEQAEQSAEPAVNLTVTEQPLHGPNPHVLYTADSSIVQINGLSDPAVQEKINHTLQAFADSEYAEMETWVEDRLPELLTEQAHWIEIFGDVAKDESFFYGNIYNKYTVTYQGDNVLSVISEGYVSQMPETHPGKFRAAFVFDLKTGEQLKLKDALKPSDTLLEDLQKIVIAKIAEGKLRPEGVIQDYNEHISFGEHPTLIDLEGHQFYLREEGGKRLLTLYEPSNHAIGNIELDLSQEDLGELADPNSPIWQ